MDKIKVVNNYITTIIASMGLQFLEKKFSLYLTMTKSQINLFSIILINNIPPTF